METLPTATLKMLKLRAMVRYLRGVDLVLRVVDFEQVKTQAIVNSDGDEGCGCHSQCLLQSVRATSQRMGIRTQVNTIV